jgi:hypothetical protein
MITKYEFGKFTIDGKVYESNIKMLNEKVITYHYLEDHKLTLGDLADLVNSRPSYIIIGTGAYGVIKVLPAIKEFIENQKIKLIIQKTSDACTKYNELIKDHKKVAAFLHNTC